MKPHFLFRQALKAVAAVVIPLAGLALAHEVFVVGIGQALGSLSEALWLREWLTNVPFSAARSWLMVSTLSQISPDGLAVTGALGEFLHELFPAIFFKSELIAPGTWVSAVISPESTPLARLTTQAIVEVVTIAIGSTLVLFGFRRTSPGDLLSVRPVKPLVLIGWGLFIQIQAIAVIISTALTIPILEDMGLGFVIGPFVEGNPLNYKILMGSVVPMSLRIFLLVLGLFPMLLIKTASPTQRVSLATLALVGASLWTVVSTFPPYMGLIPKEVKSWSEKTSNVEVPAVPEAVASEVLPSVLPNETPTRKVSAPEAINFRPLGPRVVAIERIASTGEFRLLINGTASTVRGVHYYFGDLLKKPLPEREKILRRDLAIIREVGFTAVTGWEEEGFDEKFLKLASEYDMPVIVPISLEPSRTLPDGSSWLAKGDFLDPTVRSEIKQRITQKLTIYKNDPSVLSWNIGADEPLERMSRHYKRPPEQVQAAADLIVELVMLAHEIDPAHPVIVSEPQDWYVGFYQVSLEKARRTGIDPSQFFIVGGNFYQAGSVKTDLRRVKTAVTEKLNVAFAVMEWAPFGVNRTERPLFRSRMAKDVAEATPISIVYVFNPAIDPLNFMPDPTLAIVTGLSLTDQDRTDANGLLTAIAGTLGRPLFPTALQILKADREQGWSGIPVSRPIVQERGEAQYFIGTGPDGKLIAYRWFFNERTNVLVGPEIVSQIIVRDSQKTIVLGDTFLQTYLGEGGLARFGLPETNVYETVMGNWHVLRQDFTKGWALIQKVTGALWPHE